MKNRRLNVLADVPDLRDRLYSPTLRGLEATYNSQPFADPASSARVKNQEQTSACTGFALSAMVEALAYGSWVRHAQQGPPPNVISPFMLYYFARRYDDIPGTADGDGSTARGAMKAWHKHGACRESLWPGLDVNVTTQGADWSADAFKTPLGAYFRVDHTSVPDMHAAMSETGYIYVTSQVHTGWDNPPEGIIPFDGTQGPIGGHAFLLVGYDQIGFWLQNSWDVTWGNKGFARMSYADWAANGMDAWVAQIGVQISAKADDLATGLRYTPVAQKTGIPANEPAPNLSSNANLSAQQINPYIINLTNNGMLSDSGQFATKVEDLRALLSFYLPNALTQWQLGPQDPIDVAIYAHGGLTDEGGAANTARNWVPALFNRRIFPVFLMWETGFFDIIKDIIADRFDKQAKTAAAGGFWDKIVNGATDFWDERLEGLASAPGTAEWDEMKKNAQAASTNKLGGLALLAQELKKSAYDGIRSRLRFHLIGHSAGSIVHSYLGPALVSAGLKLDGIYFLAPACRSELFTTNLLPLYVQGKIASYTQFHMTDEVERKDNCGTIYRRSLLYLVSNAFEHVRGTPILGMQKFLTPAITSQPAGTAVWDFIASPTGHVAPADGSNSTSHGGFDDDPDTRLAVLTRINRRQGTAGAGASGAAGVAAKAGSAKSAKPAGSKPPRPAAKAKKRPGKK